jgi:radical SAM protein with 4Fe4S-binding SPASM domain
MLRKKHIPIPISVALELTLGCNMNCMHCGSSAGDLRTNELSTKEWIETCKKLSELKTQLIVFTGGEPFLRNDWFEIGKNVRDLGIDLSIISNGLLIDRKMISNLKKLNPYSVAISIDGAKAKTHDSIRRVKGSYQKCIEALILLKDNNLSATVVTTVHKKNFSELPEIREMLLDKEIAWQIQIAVPIGRFPDDLILSKEEFYSVGMFIAQSKNKYSIRRLPVMGAHSIGYNPKIILNPALIPRWKGCQAGISALGIKSNGGVIGCLSLPDDFVEDNIRNRDIREIWNDPDMFTYNRKFTSVKLKGDCKDCKYGKSCKGGCLTVSSSVTGKKHCDPYCFHLIEKEMIAK